MSTCRRLAVIAVIAVFALATGGTSLAIGSAVGAEVASCSDENPEEWDTTNCEQEDSFNCQGACGVGCKSCEVEYIAGFCGWMCEPIRLSCYTRPCCAEHDDCLSKAQSEADEWECHEDAARNGCTLADAAGQTADEPDASPMIIDLCVSLFQPEPECGYSEVTPEQR